MDRILTHTQQPVRACVSERRRWHILRSGRRIAARRIAVLLSLLASCRPRDSAAAAAAAVAAAAAAGAAGAGAGAAAERDARAWS